MAKALFDLELSGFVFPQGNPALIRDRRYPEGKSDPAHEVRYDFRTFFYDVFFDPASSKVVIICPPLMNFRALIEGIDFQIDGTHVRPAEVRDLSRCSVMSFDATGKAPQVLTISHKLFGGNVAIGRSYVDEFNGLNAMYSLSKNNSLQWIQDWLTFNVRVHGANAVILADNMSTEYGPEDLRNAVNEVDGLEVAMILRARYPFGPTSLGYQNTLFLQRSLMELYKQRFLRQARAVINTDIDELFVSSTGRSIFDATVESERGYIRADARWVYADTMQQIDEIRHKHHVFCSASGKPKANRKFAVVPDGPMKDYQWLTHFLDSRKDPVDPDFTLFHFRQLSTNWKEQRQKIDVEFEPLPDLKSVMDNVFPGTSARSAPVPAANRKTAVPRYLVITAMKNEASFIVEWIAYHRVIGFTDFLVYTNDCTDTTVELLEALQEDGLVCHERNLVLRRGPQKSALKYAKEHWLASEADWIFLSDIDEFLNIKVGDGDVPALLAQSKGADAIPVTWKLFGNADQVEYNDELIIANFTDAELPLADGGLPDRFVKTLFRPHASIKRFGTHGPIVAQDAPFVWRSPDGRKLSDPNTLTRPEREFGYQVAQINHYAVGSVDGFLVKRDRGRVNHFRQTMEFDYWEKMCRGGEKDISILRHLDATRAEMGRILENPKVAELHHAGHAWRRKRITELRNDPEFIALREKILK